MCTWRWIFLHVIFLSLLTPAHAQEIKLELENKSISTSQPLILHLVFSKDLKKELSTFNFYSFPEIEGFEKFKTELVEEKPSKTIRISQFYKPTAAGKFKINKFKMKAGNKTVDFKETAVFVKEGRGKLEIPDEKALEFGKTKGSFLFQIATNKKSVFTGEGFTVTADLLISEQNRLFWNLKDLNEQAIFITRKLTPTDCAIDPDSKGMISAPTFDSIEFHGKTFRRLRIFESTYYPITTQPITFKEIEFSILTYQVAKQGKNIWWWKSEDQILKSSPITINVNSLPDHPLKDVVPVGSFQLKEQISNIKVSTGTTFHYTAIIVGEGNLADVNSPEFKNDIFEIYIPPVKHKWVNDGKYRAKILEFNIIPKEPGSFKLDQLFQWVYFDPQRKLYDTLSSAYTISVKGESQKSKEIFSSYIGSFYELASQESNVLRSKEKEESIKFFANIIILFMLVTTAILVFKR